MAAEYSLGQAACAELARLFLHQEAVSEIPSTANLLVEAVAAHENVTYYLHTPLARSANDALARLTTWRLFQEYGLTCQSMATDLGFTLAVPASGFIEPQAWRALLSDKDFGADMESALGDCASLRTRFANVVTIGLMMLRQPLGGRRKVGGHDWAERRLFDQVRAIDPDFVLMRQAEREMISEVCTVDRARDYLSGPALPPGALPAPE